MIIFIAELIDVVCWVNHWMNSSDNLLQNRFQLVEDNKESLRESQRILGLIESLCGCSLKSDPKSTAFMWHFCPPSSPTPKRRRGAGRKVGGGESVTWVIRFHSTLSTWRSPNGIFNDQTASESQKRSFWFPRWLIDGVGDAWPRLAANKGAVPMVLSLRLNLFSNEIDANAFLFLICPSLRLTFEIELGFDFVNEWISCITKLELFKLSIITKRNDAIL